MGKEIFKIFMLGGGKRVSLARRFKKVIESFNFEPEIFSYDLTKHEPIIKEARIIKGLPWNSTNVLSDLREKMIENDFDLIISNVDPAIPLQSNLANEFKSASLISSYENILICQSKELFQEFCEKEKLPIIPRWDNKTFPFFIKPKNGSSSNGAQLIYSRDQFHKVIDFSEEIFIKQKFIDGNEYTVDVYVDRNNKIKALSPRERLKTAGGEVVLTRTLRDKTIENLSENIIYNLGLQGPISIQFIKSKEDNKLWLMEINPRLGGGVIASIEAGHNIPEMLISDILDYDVKKSISNTKLIMKRYFEEIFYEDNS